MRKGRFTFENFDIDYFNMRFAMSPISCVKMWYPIFFKYNLCRKYENGTIRCGRVDLHLEILTSVGFISEPPPSPQNFENEGGLTTTFFFFGRLDGTEKRRPRRRPKVFSTIC